MRIGIVGDIHANALALEEALDVVQSRPIDQLVFLGDLLTYGPEPQLVIDTIAEETEAGAILLLGNHDAMYYDLLRGEDSYYDGLPPWIRESVDWTLGRIEPSTFYGLPFKQDWIWKCLVAAHANPFPADVSGVPDWRYVNKPQDYGDAARTLRDRDLRIGVFGHTHRSRIVEWPSRRGLNDENRKALYAWRPAGFEDALIVNAGAIGQPRSKGPPATVCWVTVEELDGDEFEVDVDIAAVSYDVQQHVDSLQGLPLSKGTIEAMSRFFQT
jgi:predicted phosphodiesterase